MGADRDAFESHDFRKVRELLNQWVSRLNGRINDERPFDASVTDRKGIVAEIHHDLSHIATYYSIILKDGRIAEALSGRKKVILFEKLKVKDEVTT